jgi:hypothetical protein
MVSSITNIPQCGTGTELAIVMENVNKEVLQAQKKNGPWKTPLKILRQFTADEYMPIFIAKLRAFSNNEQLIINSMKFFIQYLQDEAENVAVFESAGGLSIMKELMRRLKSSSCTAAIMEVANVCDFHDDGATVGKINFYHG